MLSYCQASGQLRDAAGTLLGVGYSGAGAGVNNPALEAVPDVGPIPAGVYSLGAPVDDPQMGPFAIPLVPHDEAATLGRSGFFMHGDLVGHIGERLASHGCVVMAPDVRHAVWAGSDRVVKVCR